MSIVGLHHVQLAMPTGEEAKAVAFYEGLLRIPQVAKPPHLEGRGGCWFESGLTRVHLGVEEEERTPVSAHVLRHTAITAVERHAGFAVAQAFAGHSASSVTGTYTRARLCEVAAAVSGLHCYQCSRPSRCGQYPSLEPKLTGSESRGVLVSKKWLAMLPTCQRQVAWARLYSIPTDEGEEDGDAARLGSSFHEGAASALLAEDPDTAFAAYAASATGSEQAFLLQLWENHKHLVEQEPFPVEMKDTEYGIGVTCHAPGLFIDSRDKEHPDRLIAVTFAGFADGVGREADGTPSVVELRTGGGSSLPFEPELYALGAYLLTGKVPVTVHTHRIGNRDDLACGRRVFDKSELGEAKASLQDAASLVAAWHPYNSLSAPYSVGEWCRWCPFESRCTEHRA
ncbi:MAG: PD-(D/E)XK nuclease family protein [Acidimicrobiia bacterium]